MIIILKQHEKMYNFFSVLGTYLFFYSILRKENITNIYIYIYRKKLHHITEFFRFTRDYCVRQIYIHHFCYACLLHNCQFQGFRTKKCIYCHLILLYRIINKRFCKLNFPRNIIKIIRLSVDHYILIIFEPLLVK